MKKKMLILGGTGFVGYHLCNFFKKKFDIYSISRFKPRPTKKVKYVNYIYADISKKNLLKKKIKKYLLSFNYVINASGEVNHKNYQLVYKSHFLSVKNISSIFLNSNIKKFIQIGSSMEYGKLKSPQIETAKAKPISFYGKAKLRSTNYLLKLAKKYNFPLIILRPYQIYGPMQEQNRLIPFVIKNCLNNKKFSVSDGNQSRDFLFINDFLQLINKILKSKKNIFGEVFNVGYGKPTKVKVLINYISKLVKKGEPEFGKILLRKEESMSTYPNINKLKKNYNWRPKVNIKKGVIKTLGFYKSLI